jgi:hypothetical protein
VRRSLGNPQCRPPKTQTCSCKPSHNPESLAPRPRVQRLAGDGSVRVTWKGGVALASFTPFSLGETEQDSGPGRRKQNKILGAPSS